MLAPVLLYAAGCGNSMVGLFAGSSPLTECAGDLAQADEVVVVTFSGGTTPIYPKQELAKLDLTGFSLADGSTLAGRKDEFLAKVIETVQSRFCDPASPRVKIEWNEDLAGDRRGKTHLYFTQDLPPAGGNQVGEAEYDPCNRQHDNAAIVFAGKIRQLGNHYTFDEWVSVFANIATHEIHHTLGYGHISRAESPPDARALFVELMLDSHTMSELRKPQRILHDQETCPALRFKQEEYTVFECGWEPDVTAHTH